MKLDIVFDNSGRPDGSGRPTDLESHICERVEMEVFEDSKSEIVARVAINLSTLMGISLESAVVSAIDECNDEKFATAMFISCRKGVRDNSSVEAMAKWLESMAVKLRNKGASLS